VTLDLDALEAAHNTAHPMLYVRSEDFRALIAAARERDEAQMEYADALITIDKLTEQRARLRAALERIAAMDYRGNVPQATVMARAALSQTIEIEDGREGISVLRGKSFDAITTDEATDA
jgi:hypothetical protein